MVAVGDIERRNSGKRLDQGIPDAARDSPDGMPHAVRGFEVEQRPGRFLARGDRIDIRCGTVREEHRSGLSAERDHVPRSIVFLVAAGPLVLLDEPAVVLVK